MAVSNVQPYPLDRATAISTAGSFAVPFCAAILLGWYGAGFPDSGIGSSLAIGYWLAILMPTWLAFEAGSWATAYVLRPLNLRFISVIIIGSVLGGLAVRPFVLYIIGGFFSAADGGGDPVPAPQFIWSVEWLTGFIQEALGILLLWVIANLLMRSALHLPRFGFAPHTDLLSGTKRDEAQNGETDTGDLAPEPEFITRLKDISQTDIAALEAEDHYVRVHTETESELIHYRFTDAVNEQSNQAGLQVHRSFWVSKDYVERMVRRGRSFDIVLKGGKRIPVGQTYKQSAATEFKDYLED